MVAVVAPQQQPSVVVRRVRDVVDFLDALLEFFVNRRAVSVGVVVVRRINRHSLHAAQVVHNLLDAALSCAYEVLAGLHILDVLIERPQAHAHLFRDGIF